MAELIESFRIALEQIRAHRTRSALTALGVVIGVVAVSLMGTAVHGMDLGFERSLALLGTDVLYVQKWPWHNVEDWWNYADRPPFRPEDAVRLNRVIAGTPGSLLDFAAFVGVRSSSVKAGEFSVSGVFTQGTTAEFGRILSADFAEGRLFSEAEAATSRQVCVLGYDVARALFPGRSPLGQTVVVQGQPFRVVGVLARQGSFLGLFSMDNQLLLPLGAYAKYFGLGWGDDELQVKIRDKNRVADAVDELTGAMRRVRGLLPGQRDNFSINEEEAFKAQLDPIRAGLAAAGLFVTGLALFVGAIGIMNITFVSVKERTREIGTRRAIGARRRAILLQFLIESVSICLAGGVVGLALTGGLCLAVSRALPALPVEFSPFLILVGLAVSVLTGVLAGFAPALGAARLDPVEALRYE